MRPSSVAGPVAVTRARPLPDSTAVPRCTMLARSASGPSGAGRAWASFHTAALSPVSADSSTCRAALRSRRASAGTAAPASSRTTSPGTSSAAAIRMRRPSRRTVAWGTASARRRASDTRARHSEMKPIAAFSRRAARMATASARSPRAAAMPAPASRSSTTRLLNCARASRHNGVSRWSAIWLGPTAWSRRCASGVFSPTSASVPPVARWGAPPCAPRGLITGTRRSPPRTRVPGRRRSARCGGGRRPL